MGVGKTIWLSVKQSFKILVAELKRQFVRDLEAEHIADLFKGTPMEGWTPDTMVNSATSNLVFTATAAGAFYITEVFDVPVIKRSTVQILVSAVIDIALRMWKDPYGFRGRPKANPRLYSGAA